MKGSGLIESINIFLKDQLPSRSNVVTLPDGTKFRISIETFESFAEFAHVIIEDIETGERFHSGGKIQVRGHTFITKWKTVYDPMHDNYLSSHDLQVIVF